MNKILLFLILADFISLQGSDQQKKAAEDIFFFIKKVISDDKKKYIINTIKRFYKPKNHSFDTASALHLYSDSMNINDFTDKAYLIFKRIGSNKALLLLVVEHLKELEQEEKILMKQTFFSLQNKSSIKQDELIFWKSSRHSFCKNNQQANSRKDDLLLPSFSEINNNETLNQNKIIKPISLHEEEKNVLTFEKMTSKIISPDDTQSAFYTMQPDIFSLDLFLKEEKNTPKKKQTDNNIVNSWDEVFNPFTEEYPLKMELTKTQFHPFSNDNYDDFWIAPYRYFSGQRQTGGLEIGNLEKGSITEALQKYFLPDKK